MAERTGNLTVMQNGVFISGMRCSEEERRPILNNLDPAIYGDSKEHVLVLRNVQMIGPGFRAETDFYVIRDKRLLDGQFAGELILGTD